MIKMSRMETFTNLATLLDKEYKTLKEKNIKCDLIYDMLNTKIINMTHKYYYKELDLKESHPWKFEYNMGEDGGQYDDKTKAISLNYDYVRPVDCLFAGLDEDDKDKKREYYMMASRLLSCVVHELRHAWQDEMGMLEGLEYISPEEDFDAYREQEVEVDARRYQTGFYTRRFHEYLINNL